MPRPHDRVGVAGHRSKSASGSKPAPRLIDINSAGLEQLMTLPGVGEAIARRIIEGRPYRTVDDLRRVKGIGERRLTEIRPLVTAR
jgi:DNA uptake protein ComE-like DNA-binding protein